MRIVFLLFVAICSVFAQESTNSEQPAYFGSDDQWGDNYAEFCANERNAAYSRACYVSIRVTP